jgi:hypothetical protein
LTGEPFVPYLPLIALGSHADAKHDGSSHLRLAWVFLFRPSSLGVMVRCEHVGDVTVWKLSLLLRHIHDTIKLFDYPGRRMQSGLSNRV